MLPWLYDISCFLMSYLGISPFYAIVKYMKHGVDEQ